MRTTSPEAEAYLDAVRDELGHLSEEERGDLLEDLALHLAEVADDDAEDGPVGLVARLGPPATYAAELRSAAGLPAPPEPRSSHPTPSAGLIDAIARSRSGRLARAAWRHPFRQATFAYLRQLAPAWWLVRGYLVVALVVGPSSPGRFDDFPIPTVGGSRVLGLLTVASAVAASITLGRRTMGRGGKALVGALNVAVAFAALAVLADIDHRLAGPEYVVLPGYTSSSLASPSGPVTNIYPYSRDGQPLADVLLFDQDGRPLRAAAQEWWPDGCVRIADHPRAADGVPVDFTYPQRYVRLPSDRSGQCLATITPPPVPLPAFPPGTRAPPTTAPSPGA